MNNKYTFTLFALLLSCNISAQYYSNQKHEFSVGTLAGISSLDYKLSEGKSESKFSGGVSVGYTYFFKKNIGLATGLEFAFYNTDLKLDDFSGSHTTYSFDMDEQNDFEFQYTLKNYKETQSAFYLNIPIMLHYQFSTEKKVNFYASGGFKIGLPLSGKHKSKGANLKTAGYFPHNGATQEEPRFRGFGDFITKEYDSEIKFKTAFNLAIEAGAKWSLPKNMALYTGLYLDYGLNDINESKKSDLSLVQYNQLSPEDHIYNGLASSSYKDNEGNNQHFTSKIKPIAYGIKIRLAFGKSRGY